MEWKNCRSGPGLELQRLFSFHQATLHKRRNYLLPTDTINHKTRGKTWNLSREEKPYIISSSTCISFLCFLSIFFLPSGLFHMPSFYLRTTAKPQFPVFCLIIQGRK